MSRHHVAMLYGKRWQATRRRVFERDGWRCRRCGRAGRLEADHIARLEDEPGLDPYDMDNLQSPCRGCHIDKTAEENRRPMTAKELEWQRFIEELMKA